MEFGMSRRIKPKENFYMQQGIFYMLSLKDVGYWLGSDKNSQSIGSLRRKRVLDLHQSTELFVEVLR